MRCLVKVEFVRGGGGIFMAQSVFRDEFGEQ